MKDKAGRYATELVSAQAYIPKDIYNRVFKKADSIGLSMSTYWKKWIIEGYKKAQENGEM